MLKFKTVFLGILAFSFLSAGVEADQASAELAMEDRDNPLMLIRTSAGNIYVELFENSAPRNVARFIALAEGELEIVDENSGIRYRPNYYDGMRFHRVIPGFVIQAGSPLVNPLGFPEPLLADEINAEGLGLDDQLVVNSDGSLNHLLGITDKQSLDQILLLPLYRQRRIEDLQDIRSQQFDILRALQSMTVKQAYENLGFRYNNSYAPRPALRGSIVLANSGPDSNGPEFFICLDAQPQLNGKYTVIGQVTEGMQVIDIIGNIAIDSLQVSRQNTFIYSIRHINSAAEVIN